LNQNWRNISKLIKNRDVNQHVNPIEPQNLYESQNLMTARETLKFIRDTELEVGVKIVKYARPKHIKESHEIRARTLNKYKA
jgi:hypothetical protein